ncbi:hypothetical protein JCM5350_001467 [Sporobolomyces pararoseus]
MSRLPPLSSTCPQDWRYLAEGGANLVLSLNSLDVDSPYAGKVLRLRKRNKGGSALGGQADVEFNELIIQPLLNQSLALERVKVEREWLQEMEKVLEDRGSRSRERKEQDEIDLESRFAVVAEDLVGGEGGSIVAFEIKPKWGFLPTSNLLSPSTSSIKTRYCRFCMHRYYRTRTLEDHSDGYCPLDLYSEEEPRIRKAVHSLFSMWEYTKGKANNFRIFANGRRVDPNNPSTVDSAVNLLSSLSSQSENSSLESLAIDLLVPALLESPLLSTLCHLQSSLDPLDIEGLASRILNELGVDISQPSVDLSRLGSQPDLEEWKTFLANYQSSSSPASQLDLRHHILSCLLSATFKDCSIIISFKRNSKTKELESTMKAIDLDPKPVQKLRQWFELDQEIVGSWKEMLEGMGEDDREKLRKCSS